jgi:hypothetical protein
MHVLPLSVTQEEFHRRINMIVAQIGNYDIHTGTNERFGYTQTYPAGTSRDKGNFARYIFHQYLYSQ